MNEPLNPFPTPTWLSGSASFDPSSLFTIFFTVVFIVWTIYTLISIYHWFRYSGKSWLTVPAISFHLFVSASIILYMLTGLQN